MTRSGDFREVHPRGSCLPTLEYEKRLWKDGFAHIAGIDEAGRGALAGPVSAAAVILPKDAHLTRTLNRVRDSKQMTPLERETWAPRIQAAALAWGVGFASAAEIDMLGIVPATKLAAARALESLSLNPDYLLTDYLLFPELELPQTALVKGDQHSLSAAAASVLAKIARDAVMREAEAQYPGYGFARHKGYGTQAHLSAVRRLGLCPIHRRSFTIRPPSG
jgi:ribonuclease HII